MRNIVISKEGKASVCSKDAFKFYRDNSKLRDLKNTPRISRYITIMNAFYGKIGAALVEEEGGVFIKNLGYFTNLVHPTKCVVKVPYNKEGFTNFKTDNKPVTPSFFGITPGNPLFNFWVMDRAFNRTHVKSKLHKALMSGKQYKTYVSTLHSMYSIKR